MKPEILLIDLSSLFWMSWHATENDVASDAIKLTLAAVRRCENQTRGGNPNHLTAICLDKGRSFRKDIAPSYKAQRPEKDHSALNQLRDCKQQLADAGYLLWGADGFEADDVVATACKAAVDAGHEVCIASADKDLLQLLAMPGVCALRTYNTWPLMWPKDVIEKVGVDPAGLGDFLALCGDKSDNIEGAKGVGPVTAKKLLLDHYNLDGIYGRIEQLVTMGGGKLVTKTPEAAKVATPAVIQSLYDNKDKVLLARKLVTLRTDAPIKFEEIFEKREPKAAQEIPDMDKFEDERIATVQKTFPNLTVVSKDIPSPSITGEPAAKAESGETEAARRGEAAAISSEAPKDRVEPVSTALAHISGVQRSGADFATLRSQIQQHKEIVAPGCSSSEMDLFTRVCLSTGLDPFARQIYAIKRSGKLSIQASIDGLRLVAQRTGEYRGQMGPFWCGDDGIWKDVWLSGKPPAAARIGVLRKGFDEPIWSVARFADYIAGGPMWAKMGPTMVAKCAEALGLRRAFPQELSGLYATEEMEQAG